MSDPAPDAPTEPEAPKAPRDARADTLNNALDGMRQRLTTLAASILEYQQTMARYPGMPPWELLQFKAGIVAKSASAVAEHQAACHGIFTEAAVFPLPSFSRQNDGGTLLMEMLRKRVDPVLEDWLENAERLADKWVGMAAGREEGDEEEDEENGNDVAMETGEEGGASGKLISYSGWQELWQEAQGRVVNETSGNLQELGVVDYTKAEREMGIENVRTGLRKELREEPEFNDSDSEDEEDDEGEEEGKAKGIVKKSAWQKRDEKERLLAEARTRHEKPAIPSNDFLKFITTGVQAPTLVPSVPTPRVQLDPTTSNGVAV